MIIEFDKVKMAGSGKSYVFFSNSKRYYINTNLVTETLFDGKKYEIEFDSVDLIELDDNVYRITKIKSLSSLSGINLITKGVLVKNTTNSKYTIPNKINWDKIINRIILTFLFLSPIISITCFIIYGSTSGREHTQWTGPNGGTAHITSGGNVSYYQPKTDNWGPYIDGSTVAMIIAIVFAVVFFVSLMLWLFVNKNNHNYKGNLKSRNSKNVNKRICSVPKCKKTFTSKNSRRTKCSIHYNGKYSKKKRRTYQ